MNELIVCGKKKPELDGDCGPSTGKGGPSQWLCGLDPGHGGGCVWVDPREVAVVAVADVPGPKEPPPPMMAGTFAIYADGDGGFVLVTDVPGTGVTRKHIPASLVKMVTGSGMLAGKFAKIFGG